MAKEQPKKETKNKKKHLIWPLLIILVVGLYIFWVLRLSLPPIYPVSANRVIASASDPGSLIWPTYGQSAVGIGGSGVVATNGVQKPAPTASVAKIITALSVLNKKPIPAGQGGPIITLTNADVNLFNQYNAEDGSDTPVVAGEQLSEYQMLQAMLLPSADNIADSLAIWAFGSLPKYSTYANQYVASIGLSNTKVGSDASGFDPSTTSNAADLIKLGEAAMNNPVIVQIVSQPMASGLPVVNVVKNVNFLLGANNIIGIKTGNTDQAGGVFLSASKVTVNNQPLIIYTAVMQAPTLFQAMDSSLNLIKSAQVNFSNPLTPLPLENGNVVGEYVVPWNSQVIKAVSSSSLSAETWKSSKLQITIHLHSISYKTKAGDTAGTVTLSSEIPKQSKISPAVTSDTVSPPSKWWLILHPYKLVKL